ncbi:MAG: Cdc6/Cdc18 family protein [Candidatus Micrarchaeia archaeon]
MELLNEKALLPEYVPDKLPGREKEIEEIAYNIRLALDGRKPENMLIYGPPGTGKTVVLRYVMEKLSEFSGKVRIVYINCWHSGTRYGVFSEIAHHIGYIAPMRGTAIEDVIKRVVEISNKKNLFIVVVLDEMDRLVASGHGDVLYDLNRLNENYKMKMSVISIVNDIGLVSVLDSRIRSSMINRDVEFKPYTVPQLKKILEERARIALSGYSEDAIGLCAAHAYKVGGDARLAINLLLTASRIAEKEDAKMLDVDHVRKAIEMKGSLRKCEKSEVVLDENEKLIVSYIKENGEVKSGDLYKRFGKINERSMRNYLKRLEDSGIIETVPAKGRGRSRIIYLAKSD